MLINCASMDNEKRRVETMTAWECLIAKTDPQNPEKIVRKIKSKSLYNAKNRRRKGFPGDFYVSVFSFLSAQCYAFAPVFVSIPVSSPAEILCNLIPSQLLESRMVEIPSAGFAALIRAGDHMLARANPLPCAVLD